MRSRTNEPASLGAGVDGTRDIARLFVPRVSLAVGVDKTTHCRSGAVVYCCRGALSIAEPTRQ